MEVTNLLRLRLLKYSLPFPEQVLNSKLSKQVFNWNLPTTGKYNILSVCVLVRNLEVKLIVKAN